MSDAGTGRPNGQLWRAIDRVDPPKRPAAERVGDFHEIYSLLDEASVREQASRCIQCPQPSCQEGCPLSNRIPEWLALAAEGKFLEAAELSQATSNMPEICPRVCPQERLCEGACILVGHAEPICIGAIEKFINEYAIAHGGNTVSCAPANGLGVAVVGSGPGGLACADELAKLGYAVTIFESQSQAGGLLLNGIPAFKLEKSVVERRLNILRQRGVKFKLGVTVGVEVHLRDLLEDFKAVFLGIGAQKAKPLGLPGADLPGVHQALPFLVQYNSPMPLEIPAIPVAGRRVAVLGGGDTAMDCLRTALRAGATEAVCVYRRDLANMPGSRKEYFNALEETAQFLFLTNPVALEADAQGRVAGVRCVRMELGEPDASGRQKPRTVPGSEFTIQADLVLVAYGFDPVPFPAGSDLSRVALNDWGAVKVDELQMTSVPGVFAGGDASRGASLVVHAVRDGRRAALGIHRFLRGELAPAPAAAAARV
ncbi:MAG: NAD(P)-dependent oxidoreductase [Verrucomicrobiota bacterium]|nr:NAD(P)-dependent oxidoreductase [Limisphaerales bacterium]